MRTPKEMLDGLTDRFVRWLDRVAEDGLIRMLWWRVRSWFGHRMVARKLVSGERIIIEVAHSWIVHVLPVAIALLGVVLAIVWVPFVSARIAWFAIAVVAGLIGYGFFRSLYWSRDRFVLTDTRVFRVWGLFSLREAEMEVVRLLDVTVLRPWYLRPFSSGHLVLENAAQQQGIREIQYVPRPEDIARLIHKRRREMTGAGPKTPEKKKANPRRPDHPATNRPVTARRR
ncbi:PH domain-containing protein [Phytoactinopolyspora endophytica]|uniref:PH domain-containing protein n=1 Tax=Phytoactinopolyspora endophytica TaxID=1642495 RepID=UPI00101DCDD8|nr:PH domain-containing protein [Phytoactinopolyspora endophytica]